MAGRHRRSSHGCFHEEKHDRYTPSRLRPNTEFRGWRWTLVSDDTQTTAIAARRVRFILLSRCQKQKQIKPIRVFTSTARAIWQRKSPPFRAPRVYTPVYNGQSTCAHIHHIQVLVYAVHGVRYIIRNETSDRVIDTAPRNISYYIHGATRRTRTPGRPRKSAPGDVHLYTRNIYVHTRWGVFSRPFFFFGLFFFYRYIVRTRYHNAVLSATYPFYLTPRTGCAVWTVPRLVHDIGIFRGRQRRE